MPNFAFKISRPFFSSIFGGCLGVASDDLKIPQISWSFLMIFAARLSKVWNSKVNMLRFMSKHADAGEKYTFKVTLSNTRGRTTFITAAENFDA